MKIPLRPLVIIPTYKERGNITGLLQAALRTDSRLHALVVDDNSPDKTAEAVLSLKEGEHADSIHLLSRPAKLGLGSAYVSGFKWGLEHKHDYMIQMDADWSHNPSDLATMLRYAEEYDFVIASRYIKGGGTHKWGLGRRFLSKLASIYSRLILGSDFADFTGGFNGWSAKLLEAVDLDSLKSDGYSFQIELKYLADKLGFRHMEFPITFAERRGGQSKMTLEIPLEAIWRVWKFRWDWSRSHRK
jgi:dolichol-phosphate mannosyltransferase